MKVLYSLIMENVSNQLDNYGFVTWKSSLRECAKRSENQNKSRTKHSKSRQSKETKKYLEAADNKSVEVTWWKWLFKTRNVSKHKSENNKLAKYESDSNLMSKSFYRKQKNSSSARRCKSILLDNERLKLNEVDLEGFGDYCLIDLTSKTIKNNSKYAEKRTENKNNYPELLAIEVEKPNLKKDSNKAESHLKISDEQSKDKPQTSKKKDENQFNKDCSKHKPRKRRFRFTFLQIFSFKQRKKDTSYRKGLKVEKDSESDFKHKDAEQCQILLNRKFASGENRIQRKVLVHIHTKEEISVKNGVPQWCNRRSNYTSGSNGALTINNSLSSHRCSTATDLDDEFVRKDVDVTDSLKRNQPDHGLVVVAEVHLQADQPNSRSLKVVNQSSFRLFCFDRRSLNSNKSSTLPRSSIKSTKKESLHKSIKGENGSLRKLNLLQFERSMNKQETEARLGRFFAITGITTTTDYEFLEYTNRKNKRKELQLKHPEISSLPIKNMAQCIRHASRARKTTYNKHNSNSPMNKPLHPKTLQRNQNQFQFKPQNYEEESKPLTSTPNCDKLNTSKRCFSDSDLSSFSVTPLKMQPKNFGFITEDEEGNLTSKDQKIKSERFLQRIKQRLERIERLKNNISSKTTSLQDLSSYSNDPNSLQKTNNFKNLIKSRIENKANVSKKSLNANYQTALDVVKKDEKNSQQTMIQRDKPSVIPSSESLESFEESLQRVASTTDHSRASSYNNDPIMITMLDAMRKISVKYSSRDCLLNQSSSCASSTSNDDGINFKATKFSTRPTTRPYSSHEAYTTVRRAPRSSKTLEESNLSTDQFSWMNRRGLRGDDVRNFMFWDCDETDL